MLRLSIRLNCTCHFGQFIFGKIIKIVATRSHLLKIYAPTLPSWILGVLLLREKGREKEENRGREGRAKGIKSRKIEKKDKMRKENRKMREGKRGFSQSNFLATPLSAELYPCTNLA